MKSDQYGLLLWFCRGRGRGRREGRLVISRNPVEIRRFTTTGLASPPIRVLANSRDASKQPNVNLYWFFFYSGHVSAAIRTIVIWSPTEGRRFAQKNHNYTYGNGQTRFTASVVKWLRDFRRPDVFPLSYTNRTRQGGQTRAYNPPSVESRFLCIFCWTWWVFRVLCK